MSLRPTVKQIRTKLRLRTDAHKAQPCLEDKNGCLCAGYQNHLRARGQYLSKYQVGTLILTKGHWCL